MDNKLNICFDAQALKSLKEMTKLFSEVLNEWVLTKEPDGNFLQSEFEDKNNCYAAIMRAKEAIKKCEPLT